MTEFSGEPAGEGRRVCLVVSRFNPMVTERLAAAARAELLRRGVREERIDIVHVPGAWELTAGVRRALARGYDAIVALGCVVRGETPHFEYVCEAATSGLVGLQRAHDTPIAFGVLTTDDLQQALARAGGEAGSKGADAARAALEMCSLFDRFR